jgi:hypothetical protein
MLNFKNYRTTDNFNVNNKIPNTQEGTMEFTEDLEETGDIPPSVPTTLPNSVPSTSHTSAEQPQKRRSVLEHTKPKKKTLAQQWEKVLEKATDMLVSDDKSSNSNPQPLNSFAVFISDEMLKLGPDEQDEFKFGVMDVLRKVKRTKKI